MSFSLQIDVICNNFLFYYVIFFADYVILFAAPDHGLRR